MKKTQVISIGDFEVNIQRKKIKNMYLRIKPTGEIVVSAHPKMELELIQQFLISKQGWIEAKHQQLLAQPHLSLREHEIRYLGMTLTKKRLAASQVKFLIQHETLRMEIPPHFTEEKVESLLQAWLVDQLDVQIKGYLKQYWPYFEVQGILPVTIKYRQMTSTWGVCRPVRGCITFNKRLIHERPQFIEYVVVHELCHLIHPDHSNRFYGLLGELMPHWKSFQYPYR